MCQVAWPDIFMSRATEKYDGSSNPSEFIQIYMTVIEAIGGDVLVMETMSWLINQPESTTLTSDQLYLTFSATSRAHTSGLPLLKC